METHLERAEALDDRLFFGVAPRTAALPEWAFPFPRWCSKREWIEAVEEVQRALGRSTKIL